MQTCETCAHWADAYDTYGLAVRRCAFVPEIWNVSEWNDECDRVMLPEFADRLAFAADGSSYAAALYTKAGFGCVQHQPKEKADD